jgi:hypothetical protein
MLNTRSNHAEVPCSDCRAGPVTNAGRKRRRTTCWPIKVASFQFLDELQLLLLVVFSLVYFVPLHAEAIVDLPPLAPPTPNALPCATHKERKRSLLCPSLGFSSFIVSVKKAPPISLR